MLMKNVEWVKMSRKSWNIMEECTLFRALAAPTENEAIEVFRSEGLDMTEAVNLARAVRRNITAP